MAMDNDKERIRQRMEEAAGASLHPGKIAELLRRQDLYRRSDTLFVGPAPQLSQIRINALLDGKTLVVPAPAIKKGFYRLKPYATPFKDLSHAVSLKGLDSFGRLLAPAALARLHIDLALTDCLAVSPGGGRLGHGTGFFDLAMALLSEWGAVDSTTLFGAVGGQEQLLGEDLPQEGWDVRLHFFLSQQGISLFPGDMQQLHIFWEAVAKKRIRKIEPLWQLYQARHPLELD